MRDKTLETLIAAHILLIKIGKLKLQSSHVLTTGNVLGLPFFNHSCLLSVKTTIILVLGRLPNSLIDAF